MSVDVTFFESIPCFSPHVSITISKTVRPSLTMLLHTPASTVSLPVPPTKTTDPPASKSVRDLRYVYTHRPKVPSCELVPANPSPVEGPPPLSTSTSDLDIPVALQKGKRSCTDHTILNFVSYDHFNLTFCQFALFCLRVYTQVLYRGFIGTCLEAGYGCLEALASRGTWELVSALTNTVVVGCPWSLL